MEVAWFALTTKNINILEILWVHFKTTLIVGL